MTSPATNPKGARAVLIVLCVLAILFVGLIATPFASALLMAGVLASAIAPWHERLARRLGERRTLAATLITIGALLAVVLPVGTMVAFVVKEAIEAIAWVRETLASEGAAGLLAAMPAPLRRLVDELREALPRGEDMVKLGEEGGQQAARLAGGVLKATSTVFLQTAMMLIALFFFLTDGPRLVDWLNEVVPLKKGQTRELLRDFRKMSVSILASILATAGAQAAVGLIGYLIARVPNVLFFTLVTFFMAFIPAIGGGGTGVAVAALLFFTGHTKAAIFLTIYAVVIVGLVDNLVKPLLMRVGVAIHGGVVFFALLGGLAMFGAIGLLAGPLIMAFFLTVIRMYQRDYAAQYSSPEIGDQVGR